jgi:hypothetical protein
MAVGEFLKLGFMTSGAIQGRYDGGNGLTVVKEGIHIVVVRLVALDATDSFLGVRAEFPMVDDSW